MVNQDLLSLKQPIESKKYIVHRINIDSIQINEEERDFLVSALASSTKKFVQVGEHTIVLSSITGIDPIQEKAEIDYTRYYQSSNPNEKWLPNYALMALTKEKLRKKIRPNSDKIN